ncbi:MAG: imidazole glycerol phosphate synthase subunit HisH [Pseudomonadota bacterium]
MLTIVDYGLGNILAFANVYRRANVPFAIATTAAQLEGATRIILPGVGAFDHAMNLLDASGMRETLDRLVLEQQVPVMGICVGMQILADGSDEGSRPGLGWVKGNVRKFDVSTFTQATHLPHMGWNDVAPTRADRLFAGLEKDARFYFLHSFYFECQNQGDALAVSTYGGDFACAVNTGNIYGVQFHPEKSHHFGMQLLKNFSEA